MTKNLDDLITLGLGSPDQLTVDLAKNLEVWREYAFELQKGVKTLDQIMNKAEAARHSGA